MPQESLERFAGDGLLKALDGAPARRGAET